MNLYLAVTDGDWFRFLRGEERCPHRGYVTVTPDGRVRISRRLKDEFDNGEIYYPLDGNEIWRPAGEEEKPRREFLEWHSDTVFRG